MSSNNCYKLKIKQLKMHRCKRRFLEVAICPTVFPSGAQVRPVVFIYVATSIAAVETNVSLGATIDQTCDFVSFTKEVKTH